MLKELKAKSLKSVMIPVIILLAVGIGNQSAYGSLRSPASLPAYIARYKPAVLIFRYPHADHSPIFPARKKERSSRSVPFYCLAGDPCGGQTAVETGAGGSPLLCLR